MGTENSKIDRSKIISDTQKALDQLDIEEMKKDIDDLEKTLNKKIAKTILGLGLLGVALKISDDFDIFD